MSVPPDVVSAADQYYREESRTVVPGVFMEHIDMAGRLSVRSAKGISIEKYGLIATPKRIRQPEDYSTAADSRENGNYNHAGITDPNLPQHSCKDITHEGDDPKALKAAVGVFDTVAYTSDWLPNNAFHYHNGDFYLPEESDHPLQVAQATIPISALLDKSFIDYSDWQDGFEKKLNVDHKHNDESGGVSYFANRAGFYITDDGTVILRSGSGGEIRINEHITLSAPGNVEMHAGKNVTSFAGYDVILKAKRTIEQAANDGSVLIKADKDLQMISGNSGQGGTLIENRADNRKQDYPSSGGDDIESSGVVIKANRADFVTITNNAYIRTGNASSGINEGEIILDAAKGSKAIRTISSDLIHQVQSRVEYLFGRGSIDAVSYISRNGPVWSGDIQAKGSIYATGGLEVVNSIASLLGTVSTASGGDMGRLLDGSARARQVQQLVSGALDITRDNALEAKTEFDQDWYGEGKPGNDAVQRAISFCFRQSGQIGTLNFVLPQSYWQILCDAADAVESWQEKYVYYQRESERRMSYPGTEAWESPDSFLKLPSGSHNFYDLDAGRSRSRQANSNPVYGAFQKSPLQGNYKVLRQPT
jgi:hypothetical protein